MDKLVQDYIATEEMLRQKYHDLRFGKLVKREAMAERYKPITEPLLELNKREDKPVAEPLLELNKVPTEPDNRIGDIASQYLGGYAAGEAKVDYTFGIRDRDGELYIGCEPITISGNNIVFQNDGSTYKGTHGLWGLITLDRPASHTSEDVNAYEEIIQKSYVYKMNNDPNSTRVKSSGGYKYRKIIKPILEKYKLAKKYQSTSEKTGTGLWKKSINRGVEYVYWNTVEELLDRLCILYGELKAGNTNPLLLNEITNIIQEFKEI